MLTSPNDGAKEETRGVAPGRKYVYSAGDERRAVGARTHTSSSAASTANTTSRRSVASRGYALAIVPFRLLFPSLVKGWGLGIVSAMIRRPFACCFAGGYNLQKDGSTKKKKISKLMRMRQAWAWAPKSQRYGREIGVLLMIILISIAYSIISPIILPLTMIFFCLMYLVWRYHMLYVRPERPQPVGAQRRPTESPQLTALT